MTINWKALAAKNIREGRVSGGETDRPTPADRAVSWGFIMGSGALKPLPQVDPNLLAEHLAAYSDDVELMLTFHRAADRVYAEDHANDCE